MQIFEYTRQFFQAEDTLSFEYRHIIEARNAMLQYNIVQKVAESQAAEQRLVTQTIGGISLVVAVTIMFIQRTQKSWQCIVVSILLMMTFYSAREIQ